MSRPSSALSRRSGASCCEVGAAIPRGCRRRPPQGEQRVRLSCRLAARKGKDPDTGRVGWCKRPAAVHAGSPTQKQPSRLRVRNPQLDRLTAVSTAMVDLPQYLRVRVRVEPLRATNCGAWCLQTCERLFVGDAEMIPSKLAARLPRRLHFLERIAPVQVRDHLIHHLPGVRPRLLPGGSNHTSGAWTARSNVSRKTRDKDRTGFRSKIVPTAIGEVVHQLALPRRPAVGRM